MKYIIFLFFYSFSFFAHSEKINGGTVNFGGYVFESPCEYNKYTNKLVVVCYEQGNDKQYLYELSSLNENTQNIKSIKISGINLSKISMNSAITTISYR